MEDRTTVTPGLPDFKTRALEVRARLGPEGALRLLDQGRAWDLAPALREGGAVIFPHLALEICGPHAAAAVHAALDSGADRVLALGVLHGINPDLQRARRRVAAGGDPADEAVWGVQGPGLDGRTDWRDEFSLVGFQFLWEAETARRGGKAPELVVRYPFLTEGRPDLLPGIDELGAIAADAVVVATADPFHHGIGYGDPPNAAMPMEPAGAEVARERISEGLALLGAGRFDDFHLHCLEAKSDARDVGPVLGHLLGRFEGTIHDLVTEDTSAAYGEPPPTWVAGGLIELRRLGRG
jgi:hypothetical protein